MYMQDGSPERAQLALKIIYQLIQQRRREKKKLNKDDELCMMQWCASGMGILEKILGNEKENEYAHKWMREYVNKTVSFSKGDL